ncbi:MAG: SIMPL domain-containing protein [Proteobacteria bacterium]|nr:SIMPL domain-containing protein [Pseudomonadota bacterium]
MALNRSSSATAHLLVLMLAASFVFASDAFADQRQRTITVQGMGIGSAVPDMAEVSAGTITRAASAAKALADNNTSVAQNLAVVASSKIDERDVRTTGFSLTPIFESRQRGDTSPQTPTIVGYQASNNISIKVRNIKSLGSFIDELASVGANRIGGINFGLNDRKPLLNEARRSAIADAQAKAKLYADQAGVALGQVVEILETGVAQPGPMRAEAMMMRASSAVPIATGSLEIQAGVTMRFALADK